MEGRTTHGRTGGKGREDLPDGVLLAAGDGELAEAFAAFYRRHHKAVFGFLTRRTRDTQVALDLTAEVFCSAYIHRGRYQPERGSGLSWVLGIAKRALHDHRRRDQREFAARRRLGMPRLVYTDAALEQAEAQIDAERGHGYFAALEDLPQHERTAVTARVLDDQTYRDIADAEEVSSEVIRKRVSRGLARLGKSLD